MWNNKRYTFVKQQLDAELNAGTRKPSELMKMYKDAVIEKDYETSKAITEVLKPFNFETADTHRHMSKMIKDFRERGYWEEGV